VIFTDKIIELEYFICDREVLTSAISSKENMTYDDNPHANSMRN
jgi:hypothetical protein